MGSKTYEYEFDEKKITDDFFGLDFKKQACNNPIIVIFSLDTTDHKQYSTFNEIIQIVAWIKENDGQIRPFNVYMKPEKYGIAPSISVNKGYKMGTDGKLLYGENEVDASDVASTQKQGLEKFLEFLSGQRGESGRTVLLASHGRAEKLILLRHMAENDLLPACQNLDMGFIDTSTVFKTRLQELSVFDTAISTNIRLKILTTKYLRKQILRECAYVTVSNVTYLINATVKLNVTQELVPLCTTEMLEAAATEYDFDVLIRLTDLKRDFPAQVNFQQNEVAIRPTIDDRAGRLRRPARVRNTNISIEMLRKIANAGISSASLKTEYRDNNEDVSNLLRDVTTNRDVIRKIHARLSAMANS